MFYWYDGTSVFQWPDLQTFIALTIMWVSIGCMLYSNARHKRRIQKIREQHFIEIQRILQNQRRTETKR